MELKTKPDLDEVKQRWNAFWEDEVLERPMVCAMAAKDGGRALVNTMGPRYDVAIRPNRLRDLQHLRTKSFFHRWGRIRHKIWGFRGRVIQQ